MEGSFENDAVIQKKTRFLSGITLCLNKQGRPTLVLFNQWQC